MSRPRKTLLILSCYFLFYPGISRAQTLNTFGFKMSDGLEVASLKLEGSSELVMIPPASLFSMDVNGSTILSNQAKVMFENNQIRLMFPNGITGILNSYKNGNKGWKGVLKLLNRSSDTLVIENMVPFGATADHVYIGSEGPPSLTRAKLFLPDQSPVSLILPDNAWEMGYGARNLDDNYAVCAISRRTGKDNARFTRYKTILPPNGTVEYTFYADIYMGIWQNGVKKMFHQNYLYDLDTFDKSLYEREDLKWIRDKYIITLQFAWDKDFYDSKTEKFNFYDFLEDGKKLFGGYDVYGIWPTWPRLGVDQRSQWELYEDLPYGLPKLKELAKYANSMGTKFFISYNPWDKSTGSGDHLQQMAHLVEAIQADGVVLDTRGSSSKQLQEAVDSVRKGVIMYSEGMAVPKDMPGIVAGRVHNAIEISPVLNLNKLIKPDFAIFRVVTLNKGNFHRDLAVSFFNGYGTEINRFNPGKPDWLTDQMIYLGKTTRILRENSSVFLFDKWTPLISTRKDKIWANRWGNGSKVLYTVLSQDPAGVQGPLFEVFPVKGKHFVSLWNHEELIPEVIEGKNYIPVKVDAYNSDLQGTNASGNIDCIALLPEMLKVKRTGDSLMVVAGSGNLIRIWNRDVSYQEKFTEFKNDSANLNLLEVFNRNEGKFIVQLFDGKELLDEKIVNIESGLPIKENVFARTERHMKPPEGMIVVPEGDFFFRVSNPDQFIPYPDFSKGKKVHIQKFYMDEFPVTNKEYLTFLQMSKYKPQHPENFLKHWEKGMYPEGQDNYPVVNISLEDAQAYAAWAGKRLPTEIEWQYAAQGSDERKWPWGNNFHGTRCNNSFGQPTPVDAFPKGASPFHLMDMVGNIWQFTSDVYTAGTYRYVIIRGGSYFNPKSSGWYVKGGPQPLNRTQMLLLLSPGFDRNATVGFRCVADAE